MEKNIRLELVVGLDVGDRKSRYAVVNREGELVEEGTVETTREGLSASFGGRQRMMVVIETGTHSPWISRLLEELGHQVLVANARKLAAIYLNRRKRDRIDAEAEEGTKYCWQAGVRPGPIPLPPPAMASP